MRLKLQAPHLHRSLSRLCRLFSILRCTFFILKRLPRLHKLQNLPLLGHASLQRACSPLHGPVPRGSPHLVVVLALHRFPLPHQPPGLNSAHSRCSTNLLVSTDSRGSTSSQIRACICVCFCEQTRMWGIPRSELPPSADTAISCRWSTCCLHSLARHTSHVLTVHPTPERGTQRGRRYPFSAPKAPTAQRECRRTSSGQEGW